MIPGMRIRAHSAHEVHTDSIVLSLRVEFPYSSMNSMSRFQLAMMMDAWSELLDNPRAGLPELNRLMDALNREAEVNNVSESQPTYANRARQIDLSSDNSA